MTFTLKDYNELKKHFDDTVKVILKRDEKETVEQLDEVRRNQIKFLQYLIKELDAAIEKVPSRRQDATVVLYGAMSLISTIITESLGHIHRNSLLRDRLNLAMGINPEEIPSNLQFRDFYKKLNHFLKLVFLSRDSRQGINPESDLLFVNLDILVALMKKGYELEELYQKKALEDYAIDGSAAGLFRAEKFSADILTSFKGWDHLNKMLEDGCNSRISKISPYFNQRA